MALTITLQRYEKTRDNKGTITAIFIAVGINDGTNYFMQEHWLTQNEVAAVLADETALKAIVETTAAEGKIAMDLAIANAPLPPIVAPPAHLATFAPDPAAVLATATTLKAEDTQAAATPAPTSTN